MRFRDPCKWCIISPTCREGCDENKEYHDTIKLIWNRTGDKFMRFLPWIFLAGIWIIEWFWGW